MFLPPFHPRLWTFIVELFVASRNNAASGNKSTKILHRRDDFTIYSTVLSSVQVISCVIEVHEFTQPVVFII